MKDIIILLNMVLLMQVVCLTVRKFDGDIYISDQ